MKKDGKIHIPGKRLEKLKPGQPPIVRLTPEAYNKIVELANESSLSMGRVASEIILQGAEIVVYDREEG